MKITLISNTMKFNTPIGVAVVVWIPTVTAHVVTIEVAGHIKQTTCRWLPNKTNAKRLIEETVQEIKNL